MFKIVQDIYVEWGHCDPAKIVFNSNFYFWVDCAQDRLLQAAYPELHTLHEKIGFAGTPLVSNQSEFKKPGQSGDVLALHSQITKVGNSSFHVHHQFFVKGTPIVDIKEVRVWTTRIPADSDKLTASPIPQEIKDRLLSSECKCYRFVQEQCGISDISSCTK